MKKKNSDKAHEIVAEMTRLSKKEISTPVVGESSKTSVSGSGNSVTTALVKTVMRFLKKFRHCQYDNSSNSEKENSRGKS